LVWEEPLTPQFKPGAPTLVIGFTDKNVNKLNKGVQLVKGPSLPTDFWNFLDTWGGKLIWEGINENQLTKHILTWLVDGMKSNTLVWVIDELYDQKKMADLCKVGWIFSALKQAYG
jgi:hypothetical protein